DVQERGGIDYARKQMEAHARAAGNHLAAFPPTPARSALADLIAYTVQRKK
ncbi:MAG: polyprenyl synthetase family protein, partial [Bacteroidetes bacterium]|nr:polyprenyl synthetase family protein [Bacteroidota bacterium]